MLIFFSHFFPCQFQLYVPTSGATGGRNFLFVFLLNIPNNYGQSSGHIEALVSFHHQLLTRPSAPNCTDLLEGNFFGGEQINKCVSFVSL